MYDTCMHTFTRTYILHMYYIIGEVVLVCVRVGDKHNRLKIHTLAAVNQRKVYNRRHNLQMILVKLRLF